MTDLNDIFGIDDLDLLNASSGNSSKTHTNSGDAHSRNLSFNTVKKLSSFDNCADELNLLSDHLGQDCHPLSVLKNELASCQKLSESAAKLNKTVETLKGSFMIGKKSYSAEQLINHWSKNGLPSPQELEKTPNLQNLRSALVDCIGQSKKFSSRLSPEFDRQSTGQNSNQNQKDYKHRMSTQMKIVEAMNDLQTRPIPSNLTEEERALHIKCRAQILEQLNSMYQSSLISNDKLLRGPFRTVLDETSSDNMISQQLGHSSLKSYSAEKPLIEPCTLVYTGISSCVTKLDGPNGKKSIRTNTTGLSIDQMKTILDKLQDAGFSVKYKVRTKGGARKLDYKIVGSGHKDKFQQLVSQAKAENESKKTETATLKTENQPKPVEVKRTGSIKSKDPRKEALAARQLRAIQDPTQRSQNSPG